MNHFIKLTSCVINKLHIIEILRRPNKYYVYMSNSQINGAMIFTAGSIRIRSNIIKICEKDNKQDYDTITRFIEEIK